jgi:hypothetical protein
MNEIIEISRQIVTAYVEALAQMSDEFLPRDSQSQLFEDRDSDGVRRERRSRVGVKQKSALADCQIP